MHQSIAGSLGLVWKARVRKPMGTMAVAEAHVPPLPQGFEHALRFQPGRLLEQLLDLRPHRFERVLPRPVLSRLPRRKPTLPAVLPTRVLAHPRSRRLCTQRPALPEGARRKVLAV